MSSDPQNLMIINFVFLFSFFLHDFTPNAWIHRQNKVERSVALFCLREIHC